MKKLFLLAICGMAMTARAQYRFYFGNIHAHTAYSDGTKDNPMANPATAYAYAKGAYHMDFLGIAEHNHYSASNNPGMHVADFSRGMYQADTSNQNGAFVCMFGMEYGVISNGGHVIIYGVPGLIGWEAGSGGWGASDNFDIYNGKYDYQSLWNTINSYPDAFATLAHPENNDYGYLLEGIYSAPADHAVVGCAVRSGSAFSTTNDYSDGPATLYESKYFKALSRGYHLGPVIDHDNHYTTFGRTSRSRTVVIARALDRDSIMAAYKAGRFYASDDWDAEVTFLVNNRMMGESDTASGNTEVMVQVYDPAGNTGGPDPVSKIELYCGVPGSGQVPAVLASNTDSARLSYTHITREGDSFYYFARITQADGDRIWTAPVWVRRSGEAGPVAISAPGFARTEGLQLWPNPAHDAIGFRLNVREAGTLMVKIYDMQGREVLQAAPALWTGDNRVSLDIRALRPGMYMLTLSNAAGRISEARFLKQ